MASEQRLEELRVQARDRYAENKRQKESMAAIAAANKKPLPKYEIKSYPEAAAHFGK